MRTDRHLSTSPPHVPYVALSFAEECLLHHNRNPELGRSEIEGWLRSMLGVQVSQSWRLPRFTPALDSVGSALPCPHEQLSLAPASPAHTDHHLAAQGAVRRRRHQRTHRQLCVLCRAGARAAGMDRRRERPPGAGGMRMRACVCGAAAASRHMAVDSGGRCAAAPASFCVAPAPSAPLYPVQHSISVEALDILSKARDAQGRQLQVRGWWGTGLGPHDVLHGCPSQQLQYITPVPFHPPLTGCATLAAPPLYRTRRSPRCRCAPRCTSVPRRRGAW